MNDLYKDAMGKKSLHWLISHLKMQLNESREMWGIFLFFSKGRVNL